MIKFISEYDFSLILPLKLNIIHVVEFSSGRSRKYINITYRLIALVARSILNSEMTRSKILQVLSIYFSCEVSRNIMILEHDSLAIIQ